MARNDSRDGMEAAIGAAAVGAIGLGLLLLFLAAKSLPHIWRSIVFLTRVGLGPLSTFSTQLLHWPPQGPLTPGEIIVLSVILWGIPAAAITIGSVFLLGSEPLVIPLAVGIAAILGTAAGAAVYRSEQDSSRALEDFLRFE